MCVYCSWFYFYTCSISLVSKNRYSEKAQICFETSIRGNRQEIIHVLNTVWKAGKSMAKKYWQQWKNPPNLKPRCLGKAVIILLKYIERYCFCSVQQQYRALDCCPSISFIVWGMEIISFQMSYLIKLGVFSSLQRFGQWLLLKENILKCIS